MINIIVTMVVGGVVGWLASLVTATNAQTGTFAHVFIGIIGAYLADLIFGRLLGFGNVYASETFSIMGFFWALLGAILFIGILKAFRLLR